jgi:hypothetical protein
VNAQAIQPKSRLALLERMILASSNPGDMVADFFCGSGTTPLLSLLRRHGRGFIACDETFRALHTTREPVDRDFEPPFSLERDSILHPYDVRQICKS